jgi:hypothetical protein
LTFVIFPPDRLFEFAFVIVGIGVVGRVGGGDALVSPIDLRRIVREAVRPYFDFTLANRLQAAESAWFIENEKRLEAHPGYKNAQRRIAAALKRVQTAVAKLSGEQNAAWRALNAPVPQPVIETKPAGPPLFVAAAARSC